MSTHQHTHEQSGSEWIQDARERFGAAGMRLGAARTAVLKVLAGQDCALTAQEVESAVVELGEKGASRASVYRVLEQLEELGLLARVDIGDGLMRFEAAHPGGHHHHHMVCEDCGDLIPFEDPALERAISNLEKRSGFKAAGHEVVLRGSCGECSAGS
jgi:Fur family ferric uptake transcriptional regulator